MSWPADGLPRYKPTSASRTTRGSGGDYRATGYVLDRGRCHWPVVVIRDRIRGVAHRKATEAAAILDAGGTL